MKGAQSEPSPVAAAHPSDPKAQWEPSPVAAAHLCSHRGPPFSEERTPNRTCLGNLEYEELKKYEKKIIDDIFLILIIDLTSFNIE